MQAHIQYILHTVHVHTIYAVFFDADLILIFDLNDFLKSLKSFFNRNSVIIISSSCIIIKFC